MLLCLIVMVPTLQTVIQIKVTKETGLSARRKWIESTDLIMIHHALNGPGCLSIICVQRCGRDAWT